MSSPSIILRCLLLVVVVTASATGVRGDEVGFAQGLRERGLYRLAILYCQQQIDAGRLTDRQLAELAIELARTHHQRGMELPLAERAAAWSAADQALTAYSEGSGTQNFTLLVELQEALLLLEQAELERLEHLDRAEGPQIESVRTRLRAVVADLRQVAEAVELRRRELAPGRATGNEVFTLSELDALDRHINLSLAKALREQGLSYPARTPDRDDALLQGATSLRTLANDRVVDTITWQARISLLDVMADLGQTEAGLPLWNAWGSESPPPKVGPPLLAAGARLLMAAGRGAEASSRLAKSPWRPGTSAELDFVRLELAIDRLLREGEGEETLEPLLALLRDTHPPQWARRGESLVGRTLASRGDTTTGLGLKHAAEHYYRAGDFAAAIKAYDQLAEQARQAQDRDESFAAERAAAAIIQSQRNFQEAGDRFRRLALASLDQQGSALAHREAILCLSVVAQQAPAEERADKLAQYVAACQEHLRHWPDGPTSDEVRLWFGRLLVEREQWPVAIEVLTPMSSASPHTASATVLLAKAYRRQCEAIADPQAQAAAIQQATARLQPTIVADGWPKAWSNEQRDTAIELARLQLLQGREGADYAERLLSAAIVGPPAATDEWKSRAVPVLAMALVQAGKTREGVEWLRRSAGDAGSLEALVEGLAATLRELPPDNPQRAPLGQLLLAAVETAGAGASEWRTPPDRYRAAGLAATGDLSQARTLYTQLVAQFPTNGDLAEEFATLLSASPDREDRQVALTRWQQLEGGSQRGGPRWFRARLARVRLLIALGESAEAQKLVKLTRLVYPDLGGGETARQFEALSLELAPE